MKNKRYFSVSKTHMVLEHELWDLIVVSMVKTVMTGTTRSSSSSRGDKDSTQTISSTPLQTLDYTNINSSLQIAIHRLNDKNYIESAQCVKLVRRKREAWPSNRWSETTCGQWSKSEILAIWEFTDDCLAPQFHGTCHRKIVTAFDDGQRGLGCK